MGKKTKSEVKINDLNEAIAWVDKNCSFGNVRERLASRKVAWILSNALTESIDYIKELENQNNELKTLLSEATEIINGISTNV